MSPENNTRRALLSTLAAVGAGSIAGCVDSFGGGSGSTTEPKEATTTERTTTTSAAPSVDASPLAAVQPPAVEDETKFVRGFDLPSLREKRSQFADSTYTRLDDLPVPGFVDPETVETLVASSNPDVVLAFGSFDPAGVGERLPGEKAGSYEAFAVYEPGDDGRRWRGVSETVVVQARGRDGLERSIDALSGDGDRMTDDLGAYASVLETIGEGAYAVAQAYPEAVQPDGGYGPDAPELEGARSVGYSIAFAGDTGELTLAIEYDTDAGGPPAEDELDAWLGQRAITGNSALATYEDRSVSVEGSTAVVTASTPIDKFDFFQPGDPTEDEDQPGGRNVPVASFDFEYDPDAGEVTITHQGGDEIPAERVTITVDGEPSDRQFADVTDSVAAGDQVTVAADPGETVRIVYETDELAQEIAVFDVPPSA